MASVKGLFYIPLRDTDGRVVADETAELEIELFLRFAGWTFQGYVKEPTV